MRFPGQVESLVSYLSQKDLERVKLYKYTSGSLGTLDTLMTYFWNAIVLITPRNLAPNVLTVLGLLASSFGFFMVMLVHQSFSEPASPWICFSVAASIFVYQTLDAIDGKQARRTKSQSPLGTIFDHGCDTLTISFISFCVAAILRVGTGVSLYLLVAFSGQFSQFVYFLWDHHVHVFNSSFGVGGGVTEAQWAAILLSLSTGWFGSDIWIADVLPSIPSPLQRLLTSLLGIKVLQANTILLCATFAWCDVGLFFVASNLISDVQIVYNLFKRVAPKGRWNLAQQLIGFIGFLMVEWVFFQTTVAKFGHFTLMSFWLVALVYSIYCTRLLLSTMAQKPFNWIQWPIVPFCVWVSAVSAFDNAVSGVCGVGLGVLTNSNLIAWVARKTSLVASLGSLERWGAMYWNASLTSITVLYGTYAAAFAAVTIYRVSEVLKVSIFTITPPSIKANYSAKKLS